MAWVQRYPHGVSLGSSGGESIMLGCRRGCGGWIGEPWWWCCSEGVQVCLSVFKCVRVCSSDSKIFSIVFEWLENIFDCVQVTRKCFRVTRKCFRVTWKCFRVTQKYVRVCSKRLANPDFQEVAEGGSSAQVVKNFHLVQASERKTNPVLYYSPMTSFLPISAWKSYGTYKLAIETIAQIQIGVIRILGFWTAPCADHRSSSITHQEIRDLDQPNTSRCSDKVEGCHARCQKYGSVLRVAIITCLSFCMSDG
jgi:hypothetical protein